jgi:nucleolar protein 16
MRRRPRRIAPPSSSAPCCRLPRAHHPNALLVRSAEWDETKKIDGNYAGSGFVLDATARFGRNSRPDQVQRRAAELAARPEAEGDVPLDDDLTAMMAQVRAAGKAAPKRPTPHQRQIVARLAAAHGEDVGAMAMDRRLNPMQHSRGVLERLIAAVAYWEEGSGVDFRVPTTRLW